MRFLICFAVMITMATVFFPMQKSFAAETIIPEMTQEYLEKEMFERNKTGCKNKYKLFASTMMQYSRGIQVDEYVNTKVLRPFVQKVYDEIKTQGPSKAKLNAMRQYHECAQKAEPEKDPDREAQQQKFDDVCGGINALSLTTLEAVQKKEKQENLEARIKDVQIQAEGTMMERTEGIKELIIGRIYQGAQKSYEHAIDEGYSFVTMCFVQN